MLKLIPAIANVLRLKYLLPMVKAGFALTYRTGVNKGPGFWFAVFLSLLSGGKCAHQAANVALPRHQAADEARQRLGEVAAAARHWEQTFRQQATAIQEISTRGQKILQQGKLIDTLGSKNL